MEPSQSSYSFLKMKETKKLTILCDENTHNGTITKNNSSIWSF